MNAQGMTSKNWQRPFFTIWFGQSFSLVGSALVQFALVWWLTRSTGSAAVLASASVMALLPEIILGPFVGALVDRLNRRRVMVIADSAIALSTLVLVILFWGGWIQPWHIYMVMLLRSLGGAFHWPAMQVTTSLMVPDAHLARVGGLNQAMRGLVQVASPPLGALLMELLPIQGVLAVDIGTAFLAVVPLLFIAIPQPPREDAVKMVTPAILWKDVKAGFRFVAAWPGLMAIVAMSVFLNCLLNPAFYLMPLMVINHFQQDAWLLGSFEAANGVGMLVGGLSLGIFGNVKNRVVAALYGMGMMGVLVIVLGFIPASLPWMAIVLFLGIGATNTIGNALFQASAQGKVPANIQGRVFTLLQSLLMGLTPLSLAASAFLVEKTGIMFFFKLGGIACTITILVSLMIPVIRNFERDPAPPLTSAGNPINPTLMLEEKSGPI